MRRFEFVDGGSSKFWAAEVSGNTFTVVYGKIGTPGQRKDKAFPDAGAAQREYDKKVAEKLREGYYEVASQDAPAPAGGAAVAAAKPATNALNLPPRTAAAKPTAEQIAAATKALALLESEVGGRSWAVAHRARAARRALERLGGFDPARDAAMQSVLDSLMGAATAPAGGRRLPLHLALGLLSELDAAAFARAVEQWRGAANAVPAVAAVVQQHDALGEPELALRVAALLAERPESGASSEAGWGKRWKALQPHLEGYLTGRGSSLAAHLGGIAAPKGSPLALRVARMGAA